jgi:DNA polymerase III alpha subunit
MGFAVLEDQTGQIEAMFFTKAFAVSEEALKSNEPLIVHGAARSEGEGEGKVLKFRAEKATKLIDIRRQRTRRIGFIIDGVKTRPETVGQLVESFRAHPGDVPVTLLVDVAGLGRAVIEPGGGLSVSPTDELISAAERLLGRNSVRTAF